jgi:hypothetical protein
MCFAFAVSSLQFWESMPCCFGLHHGLPYLLCISFQIWLVWAQVVHAFGEIDRLCTLLETERITHASQMTKLRLQNHEIAAEVSNILLTYIHYYMLLSCMHDASSTLMKLEAQK